MTKSKYKKFLLRLEKLLTRLIELEVETLGSRELARKINRSENYFSITMSRIKEEKYLPRRVKKLLECASSFMFPDIQDKAKKRRE